MNPVFPRSTGAVACALWTRFLHGPEVQPWPQAQGLMHPADKGAVNLCDFLWKHYSHFYCLRDSAWFELLCGSSREEVTGPEKHTDRGGAWILLGQRIQEKKQGHIWESCMGSPGVTVSWKISSCFDLRRTSPLKSLAFCWPMQKNQFHLRLLFCKKLTTRKYRSPGLLQ